jgi:signal transduction histidine kinase
MSRSAEALWRAIAVFRFASLGYAALLLGVINGNRYSRPGWAWAAIAAMTAWTVFTTFGYAHRRRRTPWLLTADLVVTLGFLLSNAALQFPSAQRTGLEPVTATWIAGPVLAWAVRYGRAAGVAAAVVMSVGDFGLRGWSFATLPNGEVLMLLAGVAVGHLAQLAADLEAEREHADRVEAASRERERLARDIHDSVLQVLALVARRGAEAGGTAAEIGRLAGQQEAALRSLIVAAPVTEPARAGTGTAETPVRAGEADLRALLLPCGTEKVTVSGPAGAVLLREDVAAEVTAAVRAALDNVERHCGEQAQAWVLVEDEPDVVTVTVRDDGPGIPAGRLAAATTAGRLGVSHSICGRLRDLGGSAEVTSMLGEGTEVTLRVPRAPSPVKSPAAAKPEATAARLISPRPRLSPRPQRPG